MIARRMSPPLPTYYHSINVESLSKTSVTKARNLAGIRNG